MSKLVGVGKKESDQTTRSRSGRKEKPIVRLETMGEKNTKMNIRVRTVIVLAIVFLLMPCALKPAYASSGSRTENEPNNTYQQADTTIDDYDNYGTISSSTDVDWWRIIYPQCGNANFWLGSIPSGCNYNIYLYGNDGKTLLASSTNSGNSSELFSYPVLHGIYYYVKIVSAGGYSSSQYLFRTKNYPEVIIDRVFSKGDEYSQYSEQLKYNMNCYGYALQVYSLTGTVGNPYKHFTGEFIHDSESFMNLRAWIDNLLSDINGTTNTAALNGILSKITGDIQELGGSSWSVQITNAGSTVPAGKRKIALVLDRNSDPDECDYHFYVRHNDGFWSHKMGANAVTYKSIDTHVAITDDNISSVVSEDGYDDGVLYFLTDKPFVIDYAHQDGQTSNPLYTQTAFKDHAGAVNYKSEPIGSTSFKSCRLDYAGDVDYYQFIPNSSGTRHIVTSMTSSTYNTNIILYDHTGNVLASVSGNNVLNYFMTAGEKYYLKVWDANNNVSDYTLVATT